MASRIPALAALAPDVVEAWQALDAGREAMRVRLAVAATTGYAPWAVAQLGAVADVLTQLVVALPDAAFAMPGGEADWNVAQAVGHAADSRAGLVLAASLAARDRWPVDARQVTPGLPGAADANREQLLRRIAVSQRMISRSAHTVAGHETDPCPLEHALVGRLRCGEWLLFAGVHDLLHVEQLERLEASLIEVQA